MTATALGPQNYYVGKGVVSVLTTAPLINYWQATTTYVTGAQVINFDVASTDGHPYKVYQCTTGGTSASSTGPTGTTSSITDGTATWEYLAFSGVGNISDFKIGLKDTRDKHRTSQSGLTAADLTYVTARDCEMSAKFEEFTVENLGLVNYGTIAGTSPHRSIKFGNILPANYAWEFVGTGAYGLHFQIVVPRAQIIPADVPLISEKMASFDIKADVLAMPSDGYTFFYGAEIP